MVRLTVSKLSPPSRVLLLMKLRNKNAAWKRICHSSATGARILKKEGIEAWKAWYCGLHAATPHPSHF